MLFKNSSNSYSPSLLSSKLLLNQRRLILDSYLPGNALVARATLLPLNLLQFLIPEVSDKGILLPSPYRRRLIIGFFIGESPVKDGVRCSRWYLQAVPIGDRHDLPTITSSTHPESAEEHALSLLHPQHIPQRKLTSTTITSVPAAHLHGKSHKLKESAEHKMRAVGLVFISKNL